MKTKEKEIERATNQITKLVNQVARDAREETLDEVEHMLQAKAEMMLKVLSNGNDLLQTAYGRRFDMLYEKRRVIYGRSEMLLKMAYEVYKLRRE